MPHWYFQTKKMVEKVVKHENTFFIYYSLSFPKLEELFRIQRRVDREEREEKKHLLKENSENLHNILYFLYCFSHHQLLSGGFFNLMIGKWDSGGPSPVTMGVTRAAAWSWANDSVLHTFCLVAMSLRQSSSVLCFNSYLVLYIY